MRIISGKYKGRRLVSSVPEGIRPTSDSVRESIFNMLNHLKVLDGTNCLDLYAGTGAMGIEAISRGAGYCAFVDNSQKAIDVIRKNLEALGIDESYYDLLRYDCLKLLKTGWDKWGFPKFDVVFIDPPYKKGLLNTTLSLLTKFNYLQDKCLIIAESSSFEEIINFEKFEKLIEKVYGETKICVLERK